MIKELIDNAIVISALEAREKEDALLEMLDRAVEQERVRPAHRKPLRDALFEREQNGSTGIGNGIAVPHVKAKQMSSFLLVVGRSVDGIPYQSVDGRDVQTVFLILAPADANEEHLQILRWVSTLARNADFRRFVQSAQTADEIRELLHEMNEA